MFRWFFGAHPSLCLSLCAVAVATAATSFAAGAGTRAAATCSKTETQPFWRWGDLGHYVLVPGGALETGSNRWSLRGGAALVFGNEPWHVHSTADDESLFLPSGSRVRTNRVCIELTSPTLRFFAFNAGSALSLLEIDILFRDAVGNLLEKALVAKLSASATWAPTPPIALLANATVPTGTSYVQLQFTPTGFGSKWRIDDVYVDPWVSR